MKGEAKRRSRRNVTPGQARTARRFIAQSRLFRIDLRVSRSGRVFFSPNRIFVVFAPARSCIKIDPASLQTSSRFPGKTSAQATEPFPSARSARRKRAAALSVFCGALTDAAFAAVVPIRTASARLPCAARSSGRRRIRFPVMGCRWLFCLCRQMSDCLPYNSEQASVVRQDVSPLVVEAVAFSQLF